MSEGIQVGSTVAAGYLFAHLLRGLLLANRGALERSAHFAAELAAGLPAIAAQAGGTVELVSMICTRFGVQPVSPSGYPLAVYLPAKVVDTFGFARAPEQEDGQTFGVGFHGVSWIDVAAQVPLLLLRPAIRRSPQFFVSFALQFVAADGRRAYATDLAPFRWITEGRPDLPPVDLTRAFAPRRWHGLITLLSPMAHGGDHNGGNLVTARQERRVDVFTGQVVEVPIVSGAAIRGVARDLLMLDWLARLGLGPREIRPELAHALLAGGSIEAGTAMGLADNVLRDAVRRVCPAWDLLGGTIEGQLMEGQLCVGDAVLVCRETAWSSAPALGWSIEEAQERAADLPEAAAALITRQGTRRHHDEIPGRSTQMIIHTQAIAAGHLLAWSVSLRAGGRATPLQRATLSHALELLAEAGRLGGNAQSGFGSVAFGLLPDGLPDASAYLVAVTEQAEAARGWLTGRAQLPTAAAVEKPKKGARKKGDGDAI